MTKVPEPKVLTTADELRRQADRLDALTPVEEAARKAKDAYRKHPTEKTRAAHQAAALALREARAASRESA